MKYILPPCGQSTDYPHFLYPFPTGTFPETTAVRGMADCLSWKEPLETRTSVLQASSQHPCLSRPHKVFPNRLNGTGTFPLFPYL